MTTKRAEHISEQAKQIVNISESKIIDISDLCSYNQEALILALDHCIKCNTCKYAFREFTPSCPSGDEFLWESYWASGRIRITRALLTGELKFDDSIIQPIFACITCGSCQDQCQAVHHGQIVDIFEAVRELAVKRIGPTEKHKKLDVLVRTNFNPYGEKHSTNQDLKAKYNLPDKADVVYFIGCTSNYRQQELRDATLSVFKKLGITFTLIDEYCCGSPLIRTGQLNQIDSLMKHNIEKINVRFSTNFKVLFSVSLITFFISLLNIISHFLLRIFDYLVYKLG
jgi:heterodisulfide reductase subunit D